jgi:DNA polymerase-3 subunit beta
MRLTCDRSALVEKLNILARGVSTRSTLPVLSGILLQAHESLLDLYSTDMELSIKATLETSVEREGDLVVPARLFTDVVKSLPGEDVLIESSEGSVKVSAGKGVFSLNSWVGSDFPQTSAFDTSGGFTVGREPFVETLEKVGRAASRDETRPILTGVLVTIGGGKLKMVATDSYRLSVKETSLEGGPAQELEAIVPVKALSEVARLAATAGDGDIAAVISENQALFSLGDVWVATRLIDGQFPNYRQLVPESFEHTIAVDREEILAVARRVSLLAQKNAPLRLSFAPGKLTMRAVTQDVGQAEEELEIDFGGEEFEIGFNPLFFIDGLEGVDGERAVLKFINPLRPGLVTGEDGDFLYLIMPIRLSS